MKYEMFSVFDKKVAAFLPPFCARTKAEGIRLFEGYCKAPELPFGKFPSDFDLFHVGEFDDSTAYMAWGEGSDGPKLTQLAAASDYVSVPKQ